MSSLQSRESATVGGIVRHLKRRYGAVVRKTHGDAKSSGQLDLVACVRGHYVAVEVKAPGARRGLTRRQAAEVARIRRAGGIAFEARSVADVDRELEAAGVR